MNLKTGDRAVIDDSRYPGVWTVEKVNPTTYVLVPSTGGRGLKCPHFMASAAPEGDDTVAPAATRGPILHPGTLVRFKKDGKLYAVIADKWDKINIALLGGDGGRYWRASPSQVTVVDPAEVLR